MLQPYVPLVLLTLFVIANALMMVVASHYLGPRRPTTLKSEPYESGMPPLGSAHERFSVKFYLVAMLFIVFDIETVFMIPWGAIFFGDAGGGVATGPGMGFLLVEMLAFIFILAVGFVYVWKRKALEWD